MTASLSLVWLRRDLRLHDHAALHKALQNEGAVQLVFLFDSEILAQFPDKQDRRLTFIAEALERINHTLIERGGGLLMLHGKPGEVMPKLVAALGAQGLYAAEDYEPKTRKRDEKVRAALPENVEQYFVKDQVIFAPGEVLKSDGEPYKVYTPYSRTWREKATPADFGIYVIKDRSRYAEVSSLRDKARDAGLKVLTFEHGVNGLLESIGYEKSSTELWPVDAGHKRLKAFTASHLPGYADARNMLADEEGTSRLSPYLRFGLVSVREALRHAREKEGNFTWLSELLWREFYAMILYHTPESATQDWNETYRGKLNWSENNAHFAAWCAGKTGYPVVDAGMRQLLQEGWMHNRARMITASFLTKDLRIDWRKGEQHFAQYLMDYDMASNVGGWQWAASTGTDAQPYFRIFNPLTQSERFDPKGEYIRRYVPELRKLDNKNVHMPWKMGTLQDYPAPIVDHKQARLQTLSMFKSARGEEGD